MHQAIEKARKAAGISSLKKNYPENHRERGCGYWAAFIGVISDQLADKDAEIISHLNKISEQSQALTKLQAKLSEVSQHRITNAVEAIGRAEEWDKAKQASYFNKIAG